MKMSKNDRNELIEIMVRSFATKEDLRNFATKEDLAVLRGEFKADKGELEVKIAGATKMHLRAPLY
jgi:TusA-related sulfurtransferase